MYQIGDRVIYGMHGVCRVVELEDRIIDRKKCTYLALEPEGQAGSKYLVPTHNAVAMGKLKKLLTAPELEALLQSDQVRRSGWIGDENQRKQTYREMITSGDRASLMQMVHSLYVHKAEQTAAGKKFHLCDENFLRDAEKLLCSEIATVLDMDFDAARNYLRSQLKSA